MKTLNKHLKNLRSQIASLRGNDIPIPNFDNEIIKEFGRNNLNLEERDENFRT